MKADADELARLAATVAAGLEANPKTGDWDADDTAQYSVKVAVAILFEVDKLKKRGE